MCEISGKVVVKGVWIASGTRRESGKRRGNAWWIEEIMRKMRDKKITLRKNHTTK